MISVSTWGDDLLVPTTSWLVAEDLCTIEGRCTLNLCDFVSYGGMWGGRRVRGDHDLACTYTLVSGERVFDVSRGQLRAACSSCTPTDHRTVRDFKLVILGSALPPLDKGASVDTAFNASVSRIWMSVIRIFKRSAACCPIQHFTLMETSRRTI